MLIPWENIENYNDPNFAWQTWKETFLCVCNHRASLRRKRVRAKPAPWLTSEFKSLMFERDKLKRIAKRLNTGNSWLEYKHIKNRVTYGIKSAKEEYYNFYFREHSKNIKQTWKGINNLLGSRVNTTSIKNIMYNDLNHTTPEEISNALNSHFTEVWPKLASRLPRSSRQLSDYITPTEHSFSIKETSNTEVIELIKALQTNKACGLDDISTRLLK